MFKRIQKAIHDLKTTPRFEQINWPNAGAPRTYDFDLSGTKVQIKAPIAMGQIAKRNQIHLTLDLSEDLINDDFYVKVDNLSRKALRIYETGYVFTEGKRYFNTAGIQNLNIRVFEVIGESKHNLNFFNLKHLQAYIYKFCVNMIKDQLETLPEEYNPQYYPDKLEDIKIIDNAYVSYMGGNHGADSEQRLYPIGPRTLVEIDFPTAPVIEKRENGENTKLVYNEMKKFRDQILSTFKIELSPEMQALKDQTLAQSPAPIEFDSPWTPELIVARDKYYAERERYLNPTPEELAEIAEIGANLNKYLK